MRWFVGRLISWMVIPLLMLGGPGYAITLLSKPKDRVIFDFRGGLYNAGVSILHGIDPYRAGFVAHQAAIMRAGGIALGETFQHAFSVPVYPAAANVAVVPLSALPFGAAAAIYTVLSFGAMLLGVRLLGVRDWRCHALVLISWPFLYGVILGAIGPFLVLGAGVAWRWRDRLWPPALALAAIVAAKIFPATLGIWLLATRRYRALALAVISCLVITFGAWAIIGFHGLAQYPQMLSDATYLQEGRADSIATVLLVAGFSPGLSEMIGILVALAILAVAWRLARRPDGDRRAFGLATIAALSATPIVWDHYMVLLFVPIALISPRYSRLWLVPVVFPTLIALSFGVLPSSQRPQAYEPYALHTALGYLAAQALVTLFVCTSAERRAALRYSRIARSSAAASNA